MLSDLSEILDKVSMFLLPDNVLSVEFIGSVAAVLGGLGVIWKSASKFFRWLQDLAIDIKSVATKDDLFEIRDDVRLVKGHIALMDEKMRIHSDQKHVAIFELDKHGSLTWVNSFFTRMTGLSFQSCLGSGWLNAVHPGDRDAVAFEWRQAQEGGRDLIMNNIDFQYIATGSSMPAKIVFRVLKGGNTQPVGWAGWAFFGEDREESELADYVEMDT